MTLSKERVSYVRVLIEVDAALPLVREVNIKVEGVELSQSVEYKFEPHYCLACGKFGHGCTDCPTFETQLEKEEERMRNKGGRLYEKKMEKWKGWMIMLM
ncbi:hypothetical protein ACS0TY_034187 [Phlomoides rotata]